VEEAVVDRELEAMLTTFLLDKDTTAGKVVLLAVIIVELVVAGQVLSALLEILQLTGGMVVRAKTIALVAPRLAIAEAEAEAPKVLDLAEQPPMVAGLAEEMLSVYMVPTTQEVVVAVVEGATKEVVTEAMAL
jgi:hypothetical protein